MRIRTRERATMRLGGTVLGLVLLMGCGPGEGSLQVDLAASSRAVESPSFKDKAEERKLKVQFQRATRYAPENDEEAVTWLSKSAERGNANAQYGLAKRYANGEGVDQDVVQAYMWYDVAASQRHARAYEAKESLAKQMPPEQIAEAEAKSAEWWSEQIELAEWWGVHNEQIANE